MAVPPLSVYTSMFTSFHCSAQVCAGVQAAAQARLDEGELDRRVHSHFQGGGRRAGSASGLPAEGGGGGESRLLQLLGQACAAASEPQPLVALESLLRELRELRKLRTQVLSTTGEVSAAEAVARTTKTQEKLRELRGFERSVCASLGLSDRREALAELGATQHVRARLCALAGVEVASGVEGATLAATEKALQELQRRERERLRPSMLRNDLLGAAASPSGKGGKGGDGARGGGGGGDEAEGGVAGDDELQSAVHLVRELTELGEQLPPLAASPRATAATATAATAAAAIATAASPPRHAGAVAGAAVAGEARGPLGALRLLPASVRAQQAETRRQMRAVASLLGRAALSLPLARRTEWLDATPASSTAALAAAPDAAAAPTAATEGEGEAEGGRARAQSDGAVMRAGPQPRRRRAPAAAPPLVALLKHHPESHLAAATAAAAAASAAAAAGGGGASRQFAQLCGVATDYAVGALLGVGGGGVVHSARHTASGEVHALYVLWIKDGGGGGGGGAGSGECGEGGGEWEVMREELTRLVSLRAPNVMRVFGWYHRRLTLQPSRRAACGVGVGVAAECLQGGSLLLRACRTLYTEQHVRLLAATLGRALLALQAEGVGFVDLAPWSLLFAGDETLTPAALLAARERDLGRETARSQRDLGPLHAGLTITNVSFGARRRARRAGCTAFDAPEVRRGGAHDLSSALWTLGCVLHLLLTGAPYTPLEAEAQPKAQAGAGAGAVHRTPPRGTPPEGERAIYPERGEALWSFVSAESRAVVASLLRPDPAARLGLDDLLSLPWVDCTEITSPPSEITPSRPSRPSRPSPAASPGAATASELELGGAGKRLLVEAHEALNVWHDSFIFDGVCDTLAQMAET